MKKKPLIIGIILGVLSVILACIAIMGVPRSSDIKKLIPTGHNEENGTTAPSGQESSTNSGNPGDNGTGISTDSSTLGYYINSDGDIVITAATGENGEYDSPMTLDDYIKINPDIYSWIVIPGTDVSYPVVQSPTADNAYLRHDIYGKFSPEGTLFTEHTYNSTDYNDRVTVIYGHQMTNGAMFGDLQKIYSDEDSFKEYNKIIIYTKDKELHYNIFAAAPYDNTHILYHYNKFNSGGSVSEFVDSVKSSREFGVNFDSGTQVKYSDKLLVLSTCLRGNYQKRYLVIAKLAEVI